MLPGAPPTESGGALYVDRALQGKSRHDNPTQFAALYTSRQPESAVAERIRGFQGRTMTDLQFQRTDGRRYALAVLEDAAVTDVVDLDDPAELVRLDFRPSQVATRDRATTQRIAMTIFEEGASGLVWWSVLEGSWLNVTLFAERTVERLSVTGEPEPLSVTHPLVMAAAEFFEIRLAG